MGGSCSRAAGIAGTQARRKGRGNIEDVAPTHHDRPTMPLSTVSALLTSPTLCRFRRGYLETSQTCAAAEIRVHGLDHCEENVSNGKTKLGRQQHLILQSMLESQN